MDSTHLWLPPVLSMISTLIAVLFAAWLNGRWVTSEIKAAIAELRMELKVEISEFRVEISKFKVEVTRELGEINTRLQKLEDRAGIIYHP